MLMATTCDEIKPFALSEDAASSVASMDYLECSTKCWLRSRAEPATGNFYAEWARPQNETYLAYGFNARSRPFRRATARPRRPFLRIPRT